MPIDAEVDWEQIQQQKQQKFNRVIFVKTQKRILHQYKKGDLITLRKSGAIFRTLALP